MMPRRALAAALVVLAAAAGCDGVERFTDAEWRTVRSLASLPDPAPDHSNKYVGDPRVIALGKQFYFDPAFSGLTSHVDMLGRPSGIARAAPGQEVGVSCNSCHDVARGGVDHTSAVTNVSIGAGAYDVSSQPTIDAAYQLHVYWNGRADSLWAQIVAVGESEVSMNGDRLKVAWRIADAYRAAYTAAFPDWPLPDLMDSVAAQKARLAADGTCLLDAGSCPAACVRATASAACLPRFPLRGRPGYEGQIGVVDDGTVHACERGEPPINPAAPPEPFDDAYDCMPADGQSAVTRIYVNWAKAIAAYEYTLIGRAAPFDAWAEAGPDSDLISPAAVRGARLFVGKAACVDCHNTPLFSDGKFHNIGIPQTGSFVPTPGDCPAGGWCDCVSDDTAQPQNCLPDGARDGLRKLQSSRFRRDSPYSDDDECARNQASHGDPAYAAVHPGECDGRVASYSEITARRAAGTLGDLAGKWRTPSLRDVAITAPYMHDGVFATLGQVLAYYNAGGLTNDHPRDPEISALALTSAEIDDLTAFLESLTSAALPPEVVDPPALPPPSPF